MYEVLSPNVDDCLDYAFQRVFGNSEQPLFTVKEIFNHDLLFTYNDLYPAGTIVMMEIYKYAVSPVTKITEEGICYEHTEEAIIRGGRMIKHYFVLEDLTTDHTDEYKPRWVSHYMNASINVDKFEDETKDWRREFDCIKLYVTNICGR